MCSGEPMVSHSTPQAPISLKRMYTSWESGHVTPTDWQDELCEVLGQPPAELGFTEPQSPADTTPTVLDDVRFADAMKGFTAFPGSLDELATQLLAGLALVEAIASGLAGQEHETHDQPEIWRHLVDTMKRRGLLRLLGQLAAGSTVDLPAAGGLRLLGLNSLNPTSKTG